MVPDHLDENKIVSSPGATGFKKHEDIWYAHNAP